MQDTSTSGLVAREPHSCLAPFQSGPVTSGRARVMGIGLDARVDLISAQGNKATASSAPVLNFLLAGLTGHHPL